MSKENPWELKTQEDWWAAVKDHWPTFKKMMDEDFGMPEGVLVSTLLRRELEVKKRPSLIHKAFEGRESSPFWAVCEDMIRTEDMRLWYVFQSVWDSAPDSREIHSYHGWGRFCDLCSEGMDYIS